MLLHTLSAHAKVVARDAKEMHNMQDTRTGFVSCINSRKFYLFLVEKRRCFSQTKNNFYLPCQFFENQRSMCMLLFLPYDRSDRTFYSQTKVNSKTSKVIASRCYTWSLGIKKTLNRQGSVNQKENSSKSSA